MKVGIDLGTTYSAVARYDRNSNKPIMIPNAFGKEITPSVICFLDDGDILVGEDAKDMQSNGTGVNAAAFQIPQRFGCFIQCFGKRKAVPAICHYSGQVHGNPPVMEISVFRRGTAVSFTISI